MRPRHNLDNTIAYLNGVFQSLHIPGETYIKIAPSWLAQHTLVSWTSPFEDNITITLCDDRTILITKESIIPNVNVCDLLFSIAGSDITRNISLPGRGKSYETYSKQCNEIGLKYFNELIALVKHQKIKFNGVPIRSASRH